MPARDDGAAGPAWVRVVWVLAAAILPIAMIVRAACRRHHPPEPRCATAEVTRGDLPLGVLVRGALYPEKSTPITCQVYNFGEVLGAQILKIVPNGKLVRAGDLLVELDSPLARDRLERYTDRLPYYEARSLQANVQLENQKTQNETYLAKARQAVQLARLALQMYGDQQGGSYEISLDNARLQAQEALASLNFQTDRDRAVRALYQIGYRTRNDIAQSALRSLQMENQLARSVMAWRKLQQWDRPQKLLQLQANLLKAQQFLRRTIVENQSRLLERQADKRQYDAILDRYRALIRRYRQQIQNCRIYAPHDGVVVYEPDRYQLTNICEGGAVRWKQTLMRIVQESCMMVDSPLHELDVQRVRPGMSATVRVTAFPDRVYHATVRSVETMPDSSRYRPGLNFYHAHLAIDQRVAGLRSGMTCVVQIQSGVLHHVVRAPVESIVREGGRAYAYVVTPTGVERRLVTLGETTERFVEARQGLQPGERVAIDPRRFERVGFFGEGAAGGEASWEASFPSSGSALSPKARGVTGRIRRLWASWSKGSEAEERGQKLVEAGASAAGVDPGRPTPAF